MTSQPQCDYLAHVCTDFEQWRSQSSGRGRILERLWRMAVDLLDHVSTSVVCRELRLAACDLECLLNRIVSLREGCLIGDGVSAAWRSAALSGR
jgi:hypothetical protein